MTVTVNFLHAGQKIQLLTDWAFDLPFLTWNRELAKLHNIDFGIWRTIDELLCTVKIGKNSILTVYQIFISKYDAGGYDKISFTAQKSEIYILSTNSPITRKQRFRVPIKTINNLEVILIN